MKLFIWLGLFAVAALVIEESWFVIRAIWKPELKQVQRRLRALSSARYKNEAIDLVRKKTLSEVPWLNRILYGVKGLRRIERFLEQADSPYPIGFFISLSLLLLMSGPFAASFFTVNKGLIWLSALLAGVPAFYVYKKRRKRLLRFEKQLPEALELIARSLKAGHAFTGALKMVAEEFADPIGPEFAKTLNEINYGIGVPEALRTLSTRVDCEDFKFFIISVIIQRETGGNLAEILENLAYLIRERFKLHGKVRVLSAEGKLSAYIIGGLPFFVVLALSIIKPTYTRVLFGDPIGKFLVIVGISFMCGGIYIMKRMVSIKV